ncbi:MAG: ribose-phosphate diphosphokinase [Candidatus Methanoperedens sp.]|nr:ribose-phosphate diphosphokinase [Candidatus Methanoperedens sp.]
MKIICGPASQLLAGRVSELTGYDLLLSEYKRFPDGEQYIRILDSFEGETVTIIQSTVNDSDLVSLLQLIDACCDACKINVVIPYMGYARQDKQFRKGESISARAVARTIKADNVLTINIHDKSILDYFDANAVNLDATPVIGKYIKNLRLKDPLIIAPDDGAIGLAKNASKDLGLDYDFLEKTRLSGDTVSIKPKHLEVKGRDVIIIDDIISTGGTIAETILLLRSHGAHEVFTACVHPVLSSNAVMKLFVSVAPVIGEAMKNI